jgi:hypothetical protein
MSSVNHSKLATLDGNKLAAVDCIKLGREEVQWMEIFPIFNFQFSFHDLFVSLRAVYRLQK